MKLVSVLMVFIAVFLITAYASLNIVMNLFWGLLNQSPATSGTVYLAEYLVPYVCGLGAMVYALIYIWQCAAKLFSNTDVCANMDPYIQTNIGYRDNVSMKTTKVSGKLYKLKRGIRIVLTIVIIYSFLATAHHIFASGIMLFNHSSNNSVIVRERVIPDFVCCGSFIFCLIRLWRKLLRDKRGIINLSEA
ncbi:MAG: hypothetical protein K2H60_00960 [Muribaculaceae bacterium]|nr:hypothetical protein [Muribaculaceae bacterium]